MHLVRLVRLAISTLFVISIAAWGSAAHADELKHDWRSEERKGVLNLISNYPAPLPFSKTGEPEATLTMQAAKAPDGKTLAEIVKDEIAGIRAAIVIADYLEEDGRKPDNGIVSYIEKIDGHEVAFIKYRAMGTRKAMLALPRSMIHAILLKNGKVCYVHLMVLYAGHQDEVRGDQLQLVKAIIRR